MTDPHVDHDAYSDCLAAMATSGDIFPCEMLAPIRQADCALPDLLPVFHASDPGIFTLIRRRQRT